MLLTPVALLAQFSTSAGGICLTGVCGLGDRWQGAVPSGVFFLAIGLVAVGVIGIRRSRA
jgi:hypothetical protein